MIRSGSSPAWAIAGANRSACVMHQRIEPLTRARIPAAKSAGAAPSVTPCAPPAISCNAPRARPPPGSFESMGLIPNGSTCLALRSAPSISAIRARKAATRGRAPLSVIEGPPWLGGWIRSYFVLLLKRVNGRSRRITRPQPTEAKQARNIMVVTPRKKLSLRHEDRPKRVPQTPPAPIDSPSESAGPKHHHSHDPALVSDDEIPW